MSLTSLLNRADPLKRAFVALDDGMSDILKDEFLLPLEAEPNDPRDANIGDAALFGRGASASPSGNDDQDGNPQTDRSSPHTQDRLARFATVDEAHSNAADELSRIGDALANISASHRMSRELMNDYFADIHRANEFENANIAYATENRRLTERADKLERLRARYDQLVDVLKRREVKLLADAEELREMVAAARLELVEAQTAIARSESLNGELRAAVSARTSEAERNMRNAELLREKNVGLTLDLDLASKKQAESRRKADELAAMHASDMARQSELMARLAAEENEASRLQKLSDLLEARLVDANENAVRLSSDLSERDKRYQSENSALKSEIQALNARLQSAASDHRDALSDAAGLRSRVGDLESEKQIVDQKFADVRGELDNERRQNNANAYSVGEGGREQADAMREEIAELKMRVAEYEARLAASQAAAHAKADVASGFSVERGKVVPDFSGIMVAERSA